MSLLPLAVRHNDETTYITMQNTSEYLLLFRGTHWQKGLSPQELEEAFGQFKSWFDDLQARGIVKGSAPLEHEGRLISGHRGSSVVDGPFAESKEAIGGYFLIAASDLDEAVTIAKGCPVLDRGCSVEVRPVAEVCPSQRLAQEGMALASA
jgi:hypothetical protein